jgi:drug/metabolite transporter (DMT)-like permease
MRARTYLLLLLFLALRGFGNLCLGWGTRHISSRLTLAFNPFNYLSAMLDPFVALGVIMMILALFTRLTLLSLADLSFVLPMTAIGYVFTAILGRVVLHEQVSAVRWLGIFLVFAGAALVGSTPQSSTKAPTKAAGAAE